MNLSSGVRRHRVTIGAIHLTGVAGMARAKAGGTDGASAKVAGDAAATAAETRLAGALVARASDESDVRFELVSALRARILAGTYRVAAADLAERLMGTMLG